MVKFNDIKFVLISHEAMWKIFYYLLNNKNYSLDKQRLPQRLDRNYWIRLGLSNQKFERFCQPIRHLWSILPDLRRSTIRKVCTLQVIQLTHIRKIEMGSNNFFCSLNTTKNMVSVKPLNFGWFSGGRGYIVLNTRRKVAMKQYGTISDCKYKIQQHNFESGEILLKGEKIMYDIWRRNLQNFEFKNTRLWGVLKHDDIWISSFLKLSNNRGLLTSEIDKQQLTTFSLEKVMVIKQFVLENRFKWGSNKRFYLSKGKNKGICSITISNFGDRIVQEVLRKLLSVIFEPIFNLHSHGFRSGRSCHTALRDIRKNFKGCKWILEGDISCFFDRVSHKILISLLEKKIKDDRIIALIRRGLAANVILPLSGEIFHLDRGFPQGSVLSSLLSNIYLHELDLYMAASIKNFNVGIGRSQSKEYRKVVRKFKNRKIVRKLGLTPANMLSDALKRMRYVRYADDFLLGLICSRAQALEIKNNVKIFLKDRLNLELNESKSLLIDVSPRKYYNKTSQASFLGYLILMHKGVVTRTLKNNRRRLTGKGHVVLKVDQCRVIHRLADKGFCTKEGVPRPNFVYLYDTQAVTNIKVNRIFRGIIEYYKLADNLQHFGCRLFYIFSHSLAKMYAAKFRWNRRATIFKIGGRALGKPLLVTRNKGFIGRASDSYQVPLQEIIYSNYNKLPKPIKSPLDPNFKASFVEIYKGEITHVIPILDLLKTYTFSGSI